MKPIREIASLPIFDGRDYYANWPAATLNWRQYLDWEIKMLLNAKEHWS